MLFTKGALPFLIAIVIETDQRFAAAVSNCDDCESYCDVGGTCLDRRRLDEMMQIMSPDDLRVYGCGGHEQAYKAFVGLTENGHTYFYARPKNSIDGIVCPAIGFHAPTTHSDEQTLIAKEMVEVDSISVEEVNADDRLPLGTFSAHSLLAAYESVDLHQKMKYDFITSSCSMVPLQVMCSLGIHLTEENVNWILDRSMSNPERLDTIVHTMFDGKSTTALDLIWNGPENVAKIVGNTSLSRNLMKRYVDFVIEQNQDMCNMDSRGPS